MLRRFILPHRATVSSVAAGRSSRHGARRGARPPARAIAFAAAISATLAAIGALGALVSACGTTATTTLIAPITGIIVRADSLVAGRGCGEADSQIYGYAVTVDVEHILSGAPDGGTIGLPLAGGSFPCYADGTFANLPAQVDYAVHVVAFNRKAWDAAGGKKVLDVASVPTDAGPPPINLLNALHPTWTTECTASQQLNVQVLADCQPLSSPTADGGLADGGLADGGVSDGGLADGL